MLKALFSENYNNRTPNAGIRSILITRFKFPAIKIGYIDSILEIVRRSGLFTPISEKRKSAVELTPRRPPMRFALYERVLVESIGRGRWSCR